MGFTVSIMVLRLSECREKVHIPANKPYITLIGEEGKAGETVITWHDKAGDLNAAGGYIGTWNSSSVTVLSDYFCASYITFQVINKLHTLKIKILN